MQQENNNASSSAVVLDLLPHLELNIDLQSIIEELNTPPAAEEDIFANGEHQDNEEEPPPTLPAPEAQPHKQPTTVSYADMNEAEIKDEILRLEKMLLGEPSAEGYIELAEFNIILKRYIYAEQHLLNALELDENNITLKLKLADVAMKQQNYARAVSRSLDIIHCQFDNWQAHTLLGRAFICLNKKKKAEKALNMALRFNPACKEARNALQELKKNRKSGLFR